MRSGVDRGPTLFPWTPGVPGTGRRRNSRRGFLPKQAHSRSRSRVKTRQDSCLDPSRQFQAHARTRSARRLHGARHRDCRRCSRIAGPRSRGRRRITYRSGGFTGHTITRQFGRQAVARLHSAWGGGSRGARAARRHTDAHTQHRRDAPPVVSGAMLSRVRRPYHCWCRRRSTRQSGRCCWSLAVWV